MRESFAKLNRVVSWLEEDTATFLARAELHPPVLTMQILSPTIVVGAKHLYVYDAVTEKLETTSSLILHEMHEAGGKVHSRYVDVVAEDSLSILIDRYQRATEALRVACDQHIGALEEIARRQQLDQREIDSEDEEGRPSFFARDHH